MRTFTALLEDNMFIKNQPTTDGDRALIPLNEAQALELVTDRMRLKSGNILVYKNDDLEALNARFDDICDAVVSGNVEIYDVNEPVGYWKPKPARRKKQEAPSGSE